MRTAVACAVASIGTAAACLALWSKGFTEPWLGALAGLAAGFGAVALYLGLSRVRKRTGDRSERRVEESEPVENA